MELKATNQPTACETFSYGQVEDYIITISGTGLVGLTPSDVVVKTSIYPNPVQDVLNIKSASEGEYNYKIYSADGKLASSGKSSGKSIAVGQLGAGMYIITIDNGKEKFTEKLIKK